MTSDYSDRVASDRVAPDRVASDRVASDRVALIRERLAGLSPASLDIEDESHLHAGHAGAQGGAGHYRVRIVAACFKGLTPVARHRLVYDRLNDLMPHAIHALAIEARPPVDTAQR